MAETKTVKLPCACCQRETEQTQIRAVSSGSDYFECLSCGTVSHQPRLPEAAP